MARNCESMLVVTGVLPRYFQVPSDFRYAAKSLLFIRSCEKSKSKPIARPVVMETLTLTVKLSEAPRCVRLDTSLVLGISDGAATIFLSNKAFCVCESSAPKNELALVLSNWVGAVPETLSGLTPPDDSSVISKAI